MSCTRSISKTKHSLAILVFALFYAGLVSCNEAEISGTTSTNTTTLEAGDTSGNGLTITEIPTNEESSDNPLSGYDEVSFSQFIYAKPDGSAFLIDFNFFPEGTDFDSVAKKALLSCEVSSVLENVDVSVSAPSGETQDCDEVEIDLANATFTFLGIEVPTTSGNVTVFEDIFEFRITSEGFVDAFDDQIVNVEKNEATLENVYNAVMDRRIL